MVGEGVERAERGFGEALGVLKPGELGFEGFGFARLGVGGFDLVDLELEEIDALLAVAEAFAEVSESAAGTFGDAKALGDVLLEEVDGFADPGIEVDDVAFGIEEGLVVVLAVEIDKGLAQGSETGCLLYTSPSPRD